jgi:hypothetical protein
MLQGLSSDLWLAVLRIMAGLLSDRDLGSLAAAAKTLESR